MNNAANADYTPSQLMLALSGALHARPRVRARSRRCGAVLVKPDGAHLTRTFRRMLGVTPRELMRRAAVTRKLRVSADLTRDNAC